MSRVKYPSQETIDQQIQQIISRSGLFDDVKDDEYEYSSGERYVKCTPVHERKSAIGLKLVSSVAAIAALVTMIVAVRNYTPVQESRQQPLNTVAEDTTSIIQENQTEAETTFRNTDITMVQGEEKERELTSSYATFSGDKGTVKYGTLSMTPVTVKYKDTAISVIENQLVTRTQDLSDQAYELYQKYYESEKLGAVGDVHVNYSQSAGDAMLKDDNIISLLETVTIVIGDVETPVSIVEMGGYSIDAASGKKLTLNDVFSNPEAAKEEIKEFLLKAVAEVNPDMEQETLERLVNSSVVDGQWCFYNGEMRFMINGYSEQKINEMTTTGLRAFSIPMSQLHYLNSDYQ
ncbi:MAG: hypothetical protein PHW47_07345 [Lachnospira sp.]|nr:hypothetical protein [Lachnospira sp.]